MATAKQYSDWIYLVFMGVYTMEFVIFSIMKSELTIIKCVSSSTFHKKNSIFTFFRLSLRKFKKIIPNTFIYESLLIKIYMNANIMNTQIFNPIKYDPNGHCRSQKVTFMFILTLTNVLMDNFLSLFIVMLPPPQC